MLTANLTAAAASLFGDRLAAIELQPQAIDLKSQTFVLSVPDSDSAVKLRSALTLRASYQGHPCHYHVLAASQRIIALADARPKDCLIH